MRNRGNCVVIFKAEKVAKPVYINKVIFITSLSSILPAGD